MNKGAGVISQWLDCKETIQQYDWFVHFEPRLLLYDYAFLNSIIRNPRNVFTSHEDYYNTGLFCIKSDMLLKFSLGINLNILKKSYTCIERLIKKFLEKYKHDIFSHTGAIRHNPYDNTWVIRTM